MSDPDPLSRPEDRSDACSSQLLFLLVIRTFVVSSLMPRMVLIFRLLYSLGYMIMGVAVYSYALTRSLRFVPKPERGELTSSYFGWL